MFFRIRMMHKAHSLDSKIKRQKIRLNQLLTHRVEQLMRMNGIIIPPPDDEDDDDIRNQ